MNRPIKGAIYCQAAWESLSGPMRYACVTLNLVQGVPVRYA